MVTYIIIYIFWFIFLTYWLISAFRAKKSLPRSSKASILRIVIFIAIFALLNSGLFHGFWKYSASIVIAPAYQYAGIIICALGISFAIWARVFIGQNWGIPMSVKEKPELVTTGPYGYVRHPIYTGALIALLGSTLVAGVGWFVSFIICAIYFIYSAIQEEKLLLEQFPNKYPEYNKRTKMLIPFIF